MVKRYLQDNHIKTILDCGCSEGYTTSFVSELSKFVVGVELDLTTLRIAKSKIKGGAFINASIKCLPFREKSFDAVCILEVLEHLNKELQYECIIEVDRVLCTPGVLLVSVPFKEKIVNTRCIHCSQLTPLYGHLHSLDEEKVTSLLPPSKYALIKKYHLPNLAIISCSSLLNTLPIALWLLINDSLGFVRKGYWVILEYAKK